MDVLKNFKYKIKLFMKAIVIICSLNAINVINKSPKYFSKNIYSKTVLKIKYNVIYVKNFMIKEAEEQEQQVQQNELPKNCENRNSVIQNSAGFSTVDGENQNSVMQNPANFSTVDSENQNWFFLISPFSLGDLFQKQRWMRDSYIQSFTSYGFLRKNLKIL